MLRGLPPATALTGPRPCPRHGDAQRVQKTRDGVRSLLLLEHIASKAPRNPLVEPSEDGAILLIPEVPHPSRKAAIQIADHPLHARPACSPCDLPDGLLAATPYPSSRFSLLLAPHDLGLRPMREVRCPRLTSPGASHSVASVIVRERPLTLQEISRGKMSGFPEATPDLPPCCPARLSGIRSSSGSPAHEGLLSGFCSSSPHFVLGSLQTRDRSDLPPIS